MQKMSVYGMKLGIKSPYYFVFVYLFLKHCRSHAGNQTAGLPPPFSFSCQAIHCDVAIVLCKQLEEDSASFDAFVPPYFEEL